MKSNQTKTIAVLAIAATLALSSCVKEKFASSKGTKTRSISQAFSRTNKTLNTVEQIVFKQVSGGLSGKTESCEVITTDTSVYPYTRTFDYGTGCVMDNGSVRKGQIIEHYTNSDMMHVENANCDISFNNFFIDDNQIDGTFNIKNNGNTGNGNYVYAITGKYDEIYSNNGGTASIIGQESIEWTAGAATSQRDDNEFQHTLSFDRINPDGEHLTVSTPHALLEKNAPGCNFPVSGVLLIQSNIHTDDSIDYGNGTCDDQAVETHDGVSQTITLH